MALRSRWRVLLISASLLLVLCALAAFVFFRHLRAHQLWGEHQRTAYRAFESGDYSTAEREFTSALRIAESWYGGRRELLETVSILASLYQRLWRYSEAEALLQRRLSLLRKDPGENDIWLGDGLHDLGHLYMETGQYARAEPLFAKSLEIARKVHPIEVSRCLSGLAEAYAKQQKYDKAEPLLKEAIEVVQKDKGPDDPRQVHPLLVMAEQYIEQRRFVEADQTLKRALTIALTWAGMKSATFFVLKDIALLHRRQGHMQAAEGFYAKALSLAEANRRIDDRVRVVLLEQYASLLREMDRQTEAKDLELKAITLRSKYPSTTFAND